MPAVRVLVPSIPSGIAGLGIAGDTQDPSGVDTLAEELTRNVRNDTKEKLFKEGKEEEEEEISLIIPTVDFLFILVRGVPDPMEYETSTFRLWPHELRDPMECEASCESIVRDPMECETSTFRLCPHEVRDPMECEASALNTALNEATLVDPKECEALAHTDSNELHNE